MIYIENLYKSIIEKPWVQVYMYLVNIISVVILLQGVRHINVFLEDYHHYIQLLAVLIGFVSLIMLLIISTKYLLKKNSHRYYACKIVGAKGWQLFILIYSEMTLITLVSAIIGAGIDIALAEGVKSGIASEILFWWEYIIVFVVYFSAILGPSFAYLLQMVTGEPVKLRKNKD